MATFLTPIKNATDGEKAFAQLLSEALSDRYLCWHDVSIKSDSRKRARFPDFILFHPEHGFWVFEIKDWSLSYILGHNPKEFRLRGRTVDNPHEQAKKQAFALLDLTTRDRSLVSNGRPTVPVTWATVFRNITRHEFEFPETSIACTHAGRLGDIPSDQVICSDEMAEGISSRQFEQRLLAMFALSDRRRVFFSDKAVANLRHLIFPDIQLAAETTVQQSLFTSELKLLDLEQEQVFRNIEPGTGTHLIFGVAGSGKTIILLNKAREILERDHGERLSVLYLCRGTCVARQIQRQAKSIGLSPDTIFSFHKWCAHILRKNNADFPRSPSQLPGALMEQFRQGKIKSEAYDVILLDEAHDFRDKIEWLKLIVAMRASSTSLVGIAYDDAQAIYSSTERAPFSLDFLGNSSKIEPHILRKNYRNSEQILLFAKVLASAVLVDSEQEPIPKVRPITHGAQGDLPLLIECTSLDDELAQTTDQMLKALRTGRRPSEIAILFHTFDFKGLDPFAHKIELFLQQKKIPCSRKEADFSKDIVKIMSITKAKGLGFAMVCIVGAAQTEFSLASRENDKTQRRQYLEEDIRYFYNAITRALETLIITYTVPKADTLAFKRVLKLVGALDRVKNTERGLSAAVRR